jgi:hypothetical protein
MYRAAVYDGPGDYRMWILKNSKELHVLQIFIFVLNYNIKTYYFTTLYTTILLDK